MLAEEADAELHYVVASRRRRMYLQCPYCGSFDLINVRSDNVRGAFWIGFLFLFVFSVPFALLAYLFTPGDEYKCPNDGLVWRESNRPNYPQYDERAKQLGEERRAREEERMRSVPPWRVGKL